MARSPGGGLIADGKSDLSAVTSDPATDPAVAPTITGTISGDATLLEAAMSPFAAFTIADTHSGAANTLTITIGGTVSMLSGPAALAARTRPIR